MKASIGLLALIVLIVLFVAACPQKEDEGDVTVVTETEATDDDASSETVTRDDPDDDGTTVINEGDTTTVVDDDGTTTTVGEDGVSTTTTPDPNVVAVTIESSKGNVVVHVHKDWAPLGAQRFLELVDAGFYEGAPIFRNIEGFMAQFGIAADPAVDATWRDKNIADDPPTKSNTRGMVTFAMAGPNTRSTQVFINKGNNSQLDRQGFAPFGEVVEGMDVVDSWFNAGDSTVNQGILMQRGIEYFREVVPDGDVITKIFVNPAT